MKKNYTISIPVGHFWKIYLPLALLFCGVAFILGVIVVDKLVMPRIAGVGRDMIEVPSVAGMGWEAGRDKVISEGLLVEIRSREYDDRVPEGSIISQNPESGLKVKKGRRIAVVVSRGKEIAVIPDIKDLSERQARIELRKNGFLIGKVKKVYSDAKAVDIVVDAFPPGGTTISRAMEVDLVISKGPRPTHAEVPNIVGESLTEAKRKIEESGLSVGEIDYKNNPSLVPGTVISQSIAPGTNTPLESTINITVSVIR